MNARFHRPIKGAALAATAAVVTCVAATPAYAASGDVKVVNTETVQVYTSSTGEPQTKRVYEQLALTGNGSVDLKNPISTDNLRNLDGFGGYQIKNGEQITKTSVDGEKKLRSVSDYNGDLPLDVSVAYRLDGKSVKPGHVVGKDGKLDVIYTVRNVTGKPQQVSVDDGKGGTVTKTVEVPIPMVGSLSTVTPATFTNVKSKQANMAGDGEGGTKLSFTMTLFPPIGSTTAVFGYTADIKDGVIPRAEISALPVNPLKSPSFSTAATSYQGGADTGAELTDGATQIDGNLLKLRDGAATLLAGLIKLRVGASRLNAGLAGDAVPGSQKLANGAGDLNEGTGAALDGSKTLRDGLRQINGGLGQLADQHTGLASANVGIRKLQAGVDQILAGFGTPGNPDTLIGGLTKLSKGLGDLEAGAGDLKGGLQQLRGNGSQQTPGLVAAKGGVDQVQGGLSDAVKQGGSLDQLIGGLQLLQNSLCTTPQCQGTAGALVAGAQKSKTDLTAANAGLIQVSQGLTQAITGLDTQLIPGAGQLQGGAAEAQAGAVKLTNGAQDAKDGLQRVQGGLTQLADGVSKAVIGVLRLSNGSSDAYSGSSDLADGLGRLDDGSGRLAAGADTLSSGLGDAANGSGKLAAGLVDAAGGAPKLRNGAQKLSDQGTKKLIAAGESTAQDYGTLYATMAAGAKRADTEDMAYGAPADAIGLTAYNYIIQGEEGDTSRNLTRGLGGLAILGAGGAVFALRRRFI